MIKFVASDHVEGQQPQAKRRKQHPTDDVDGQQPLSRKSNKQPPGNVDREQPLSKKSNKQPPGNVDREQPLSRKSNQQPPGDVDGQQPPGDVDGQQPPGNVYGQQPLSRKSNKQPPGDADGQQPPGNVDGQQPLAQTLNHQPPAADDVEMQQPTAKTNEYWIKNLCLFISDLESLKSPTLWLSDSIIFAACKLLSKEAKDINGWQSPQCGKMYNFKVVNPRQKFIQMLHDRGHWITISNVDIYSDGVADSVHIYDSKQPAYVSPHVKKQACCMIKSTHKEVKFDIINIMPQPNSSDCGVFAIACATELTYGFDPAKCCWEVPLMRQHLLSCLEARKMSRFPVSKKRRIPLGRRVKYMTSEMIYCVCRMPNEKLRPMVRCEKCLEWFHFDCVNYDSTLEWKCSQCSHFLRETVTVTEMVMQQH